MAEVGAFTSRAHAEMAAGMLEARGIPARVLGDDGGGAVPHIAIGMHGYRLDVAEEHADQAQELLTSTGDITTDVAAGEGTGRRHASLIAIGRVVLGVLLVVVVVFLLLDAGSVL